MENLPFVVYRTVIFMKNVFSAQNMRFFNIKSENWMKKECFFEENKIFAVLKAFLTELARREKCHWLPVVLFQILSTQYLSQIQAKLQSLNIRYLRKFLHQRKSLIHAHLELLLVYVQLQTPFSIDSTLSQYHIQYYKAMT